MADTKNVEGDGASNTQTLPIDDFTGLNLTIPATVTITQGNTQSITATGDSSIIEKITRAVTNGVWLIGLSERVWGNYTLSIAITVPSLDNIGLNGNGSITLNSFTNQGDLELGFSGNGNMTMNDFEGCSNLTVSMNGSGNFTGNSDISTLKTLNITKGGSANYKAFAISGENCTVNSSGSGATELTATDTLNVSISGSGNISYKGSPTITQNNTGSGKLIDAN